VTFLDVVVFPYTLAYSMMLSEPWPLAAKWLATWITGFSIVVGALVCVHLSVFFTCERIDAAIAAVRVAADRGATLHQRRRHAHWFVRIEKWLRIVKRSTWIRRGFPEERPSIERLSNVSIRASFPRSFIGVTFAVGTLAKAAKRTVLSWFGAFSIVATTWVVYQAQVRQGAADIAASLHALSIPVAVVALILTVSTFFAVNAVHWRRRGLSKWRADHLAAGYADLERIRAIMAHFRSVITPALDRWHSNMASSWESASSSPRTESLGLEWRDRGPWRTEFDDAYGTWKQALQKIEKITDGRHRSTAIRTVAPWTVGPLLFRPRIFLRVDLFSPATHQHIDERIAAAKYKYRRYRGALDAGIAVALAAAEPPAEAVLHHSLDGPGLEVLDDARAEDVLERYHEALDRAIPAATRHVEAELRRHLGKLRLDTVLDDACTAEVLERYRETVEVAIAAATRQIESEFRRLLNARSLEAVQLEDRESVLFWRNLGLRDDDEHPHGRVMESADRGASRGALRRATDELHLSLDKLLAGGDDERHYREYLETAIRDGCQTEAELVECLTTLDKVLFPHSLWERLRAALNR
jgi:hypothetical protein